MAIEYLGHGMTPRQLEEYRTRKANPRFRDTYDGYDHGLDWDYESSLAQTLEEVYGYWPRAIRMALAILLLGLLAAFLYPLLMR